MDNFTFSTPRICNCKGDMSKQWYVYFNATNHIAGERKQFRYKLGINRYSKKKERQGAALAALRSVTQMLEVDGWNPFEQTCDNEKKKLGAQVDEMLSIRACTLRKRSAEIYANALKFFKKWCCDKGYDVLEAKDFTKIHALEYADYLKRVRHLSGKTCNNTVSYLKTLFFMLFERELIPANPFCAIKKSKEEKGRNVAFSEKEIKLVISYMRKHDIRLYYATQFVRYAFIRRTELMYLKVGDIDLHNHTIVVPAQVSKTGIQDSITIPKSLESIILEMKLDKDDPSSYIFGRGMQTCSRRIARVADFSDAHRKVIDSLGLRNELIFYGWKHTGCAELYRIVKDPYVVCRQCRHSDIKMTMRYLRSLGLGINEAVREW